MKYFLKPFLLGYFLTALANSKLTVKLTDDDNSSVPKLCKSIESAISEVKDELVEMKKEIREIKEKGLQTTTAKIRNV